MTATALGVSKEHITKTPGVCGGKACVAGTRIRVLDIAYEYEDGKNYKQIAERFDTVSLADVCAALTYYFDNREEIAALMEEDRLEDEYGELHPHPLKLRLNELNQAESHHAPADPLAVR